MKIAAWACCLVALAFVASCVGGGDDDNAADDGYFRETTGIRPVTISEYRQVEHTFKLGQRVELFGIDDGSGMASTERIVPSTFEKWQGEITWQNVFLTGIWGISEKNLIASGVVYYSGNRKWERMIAYYDGIEWSTDVILGLFQRESFNAIHGNARDNIYIVGDNTAIQGYSVYHYNGIDWGEIRRGPIFSSLNAVWISNGGTLFAAGTYLNAILFVKYENDQWTERRIIPRPSDEITSIWGFSESEVYAVGGNIIYKYNGTKWNHDPIINDSDFRVMGIHGADANDLYAVGYNKYNLQGLLLKYNGVDWTEISLSGLFDNEYLTGLWVLGVDNVFVSTSTFSLDVGRIGYYNGKDWKIISDTGGAFKLWGFSE
ncbi:hypothetical protein K8I61_04225 [bacterium]|nr:hypothetical protein [bacterium]